jgi:hypothetical protein
LGFLYNSKKKLPKEDNRPKGENIRLIWSPRLTLNVEIKLSVFKIGFVPVLFGISPLPTSPLNLLRALPVLRGPVVKVRSAQSTRGRFKHPDGGPSLTAVTDGRH